MPIPQRGDPDYVDYVIRTSQAGFIRRGVINEPRVLFDEIALPNSADAFSAGTPGVFVNGEPWPLRLTHITACMLGGASELLIQQAGLRLSYHDNFYMNPRFLAFPVWGNKNTAAPSPTSEGTVHWDFVQNGQPFVLSARDTLQVQVQLSVAPTPPATVKATVTFLGIGAMSRRPYLLSSERELDGVQPVDLSTVDFRNDGLEPIVVTDMTVNLSGPDDGTPGGEVSNLRLNVKQFGNGTNARWFQGPVSAPNMQATLAAVTTGRAIVHQLPGDGYIWEPGEGITVEVAPRVDGIGGNRVLLGLAGYIMVV